MDQKTGIELISDERSEQVLKHGRTVLGDVEFNSGRQLSVAAASLVNPDLDDDYSQEAIAKIFPKGWDEEAVYKMFNRSYKGRCIIAAALLAAEVDRIIAVEATFKNPVLTESNLQEWKSELNTKMKLWHDHDDWIEMTFLDDSDLIEQYIGKTVDEAIEDEREKYS